MEIQIKVLELETNLQKERQKLFSLRKRQYASADEADGAEESAAWPPRRWVRRKTTPLNSNEERRLFL